MVHPASCYNCNNTRTVHSGGSSSELLQLQQHSDGSYWWLIQRVVTTVTTLGRLVLVVHPASCYNCNNTRTAHTGGSSSELLQLQQHSDGSYWWLIQRVVTTATKLGRLILVAHPESCYNCNHNRTARTGGSSSELLQLQQHSDGSYWWLIQRVVTTATTLGRLILVAHPAICYNCNNTRTARTGGSSSEFLQLQPQSDGS